MKDSWAEYEDGGKGLRVYFLRRVSKLAPIVLERLRPGLECKDYHSRWLFLKEWSKTCGVDTDWFRESGEFTLRGWALGEELSELVPLGGSLVPVTVTVYPQLQTWAAMREQIERASTAAGLKKASTHQTKATISHVDWFIRHDVLRESTRSILDSIPPTVRKRKDKATGKWKKNEEYRDESKFDEALRKLRLRLGIPVPEKQAESIASQTDPRLGSNSINPRAEERRLALLPVCVEAGCFDRKCVNESHQRR